MPFLFSWVHKRLTYDGGPGGRREGGIPGMCLLTQLPACLPASESNLRFCPQHSNKAHEHDWQKFCITWVIYTKASSASPQSVAPPSTTLPYCKMIAAVAGVFRTVTKVIWLDNTLTKLKHVPAPFPLLSSSSQTPPPHLLCNNEVSVVKGVTDSICPSRKRAAAKAGEEDQTDRVSRSYLLLLLLQSKCIEAKPHCEQAIQSG